MDEQTIIKLNYYLRFVILAGLILVAILVLYYGMNHCNKCNFQYEGEKIKPNQIWTLYRDQCLLDFGLREFPTNFSGINFTIS